MPQHPQRRSWRVILTAAGWGSAFSFVIGLAGCAHIPPPNPSAPPVRPISGALTRSAHQISRAWTMLDEENAAVHPPVQQVQPILPRELTQRVDFPWNGPLLPLVHKLALMAGYRVRVYGNAPAAPIVVTLHGQHTLFEAFRIVGEQAGRLADLRLNATNKTVEVRYVDAA
ncbi:MULTISPECIES: DotD/TraH family lipoprotein [Acidithiobacillus]|uniref:DotD/TraH family lipoprotein n=1 Tax=Acidithiobacillus ferrivorans TaxID=160808 RepID=UPI001C07A8B6|nr:DotD/TraH family lipoprotein [Acidithiobacillus ferrivorans]MBU2852311.1 DotD/TraH family lipoprotein [Acidithiobacillus ferrivorans]